MSLCARYWVISRQTLRLGDSTRLSVKPPACRLGTLGLGRARLSTTATAVTGAAVVEFEEKPVEDVVDVEIDAEMWPGAVYVPPDCSALGRSATRVNLGYTCDNLYLRRARNVYTSRSCIKSTFEKKGLEHVSGLALANCLDLLELMSWNHEHGIHLYRMTSKLFPWAGHYELEDLPDYLTISDALAAAGELARAANQRITNHPSCYIKLAATNEELIERSILDLEVQSKIFDLMGYEPSHENKINIHVGGVYGNKRQAMERFAETFHTRLSDHLRARLTVENDDSANSYSVDDLLILHEKTGIPITFDFHHYQFCPGDMTKKEAFEAAMETWPRGVRPVVHWSEMPECPIRRKTHPHSHSNFVYGPLELFGYEDAVDVMIESKGKEASLILLRERL
jgi:UV DNA damage endonuclease